MKNSKGITLVAMVITIIVMLILAGVSISMVMGDNGVLTQAQKGSINTQLSSAESDIGLAISGVQTDYFADAAEKTAIQGNRHQYLTVAALNKYCGGYKLLGGTTTPLQLTNIKASNVKIKMPDGKFGIAADTTGANSVYMGCSTVAVKGAAPGDSVTSTNSNSGYKASVLYFSDGATAKDVGNNVYVALVHFEGGFFKIEKIGIIDKDAATSTTLTQGAAYSEAKTALEPIVTWFETDITCE